MSNQQEKAAQILLVEDSPSDIILTQEALKEDGRILNDLHVVEDGIEALDFLYQRGNHTEKPRPDIILLDLNLPKLSGREVLAKIKQDQKLKQIPVAVLTSSRDEGDVLKSYNLNANCYITKPVDMDQFISALRHLQEFWLKIVRLPSSVT